MMNPEEPAYESPVAVGEQVLVTGLVSFTNSAGGTQSINKANMVCEVTKGFWDYETGWRYWGRPVNPEDVEMLRARGTSEYTADWYRANKPLELASIARAERAAATFDPSKVYFSEHDIPRPVPGPRR